MENNRDLGTIDVKANQSARTFTIRRRYKDGTVFKYKTIPMSREEFDSEENNTSSDWLTFLKYSPDYYRA